NFDALTVAGAERLAIHFGLRSNAEAGFMGAAPGGWTAGASDNNTTGTDGSSRTYRQDNVSANTSAAAPTQSASTVGGYLYVGISFKPPASAFIMEAVGTYTDSAPGKAEVSSTAVGNYTDSAPSTPAVSSQSVGHTQLAALGSASLAAFA